MSKIPDELKQVVKKIEEVAKTAPCYSIIHPIVQNAVDHILAVARTIELRDELEEEKYKHQLNQLNVEIESRFQDLWSEIRKLKKV